MIDADQVEELASLWVAREDRGLTSEEAEEMDHWFAQSASHRLAYLRLRAAWQVGDRLTVLKPAHTPPRRLVRTIGLSYPKLAAAMLVLGLVTSAALMLLRTATHDVGAPQAGQEYATGSNQQKSFKLADGTRMELNANTHLHADMTNVARTVKLEQGEVYFEIAHDSRRPFVVLAGNRRITDIGTKFSVLRKNDYVKVIVKEGRVRIDAQGVQPAPPIFVSGDNVAVLKGDVALLAAKKPKEIEDDLNWRYGMLVFNQDTLAEAAAQFNQYNKRQIVVVGDARNIRIGGRFRASNVKSFEFLLQKVFDLKVEEKSNLIVISQ